MGGLVELPSEVLQVITGFLSLLELEVMLTSGCSLLITKLKGGGIEKLEAPRSVTMEKVGQMRPIKDCGILGCSGCFRGLLSSFIMARTIIYDISLHSEAWCLNVLSTPYFLLRRLEMAFTCSFEALFGKIASNQIVIADYMPKLEHLLMFSSGRAEYLGDSFRSFQFFIGTLPRALKTLRLVYSVGLHSCYPQRMLVEWPTELEVLEVELVIQGNLWPSQPFLSHYSDWEWLQRMKKLPNIGLSLNIKSEEDLKRPIFELKKILPPFLKLLLLSFPSNSSYLPNSISKDSFSPEKIWSLPNTLEKLILKGFQEIHSSWLPSSLTFLSAPSATIIWNNDSLPNLKHWTGSFTPSIALPHLNSLELGFITSSLFSHIMDANIQHHHHPENSSDININQTSHIHTFSLRTSSSSSPVLLPPLVALYFPFNYGHTLSKLNLPYFSLYIQGNDEHRALLSIPSLTSLSVATLKTLPRSPTNQPTFKPHSNPLEGFHPPLAHFPPNLTSLDINNTRLLASYLFPLLPETIKSIHLHFVALMEVQALDKQFLDRLPFLDTLRIRGAVAPSEVPDEYVGASMITPSRHWMRSLLDSMPSSIRCLELGWSVDIPSSDIKCEEEEILKSIGISSMVEEKKKPYPRGTLDPSLAFHMNYMTELILPSSLILTPHLLKLPSSLKRLKVAGILVLSNFHLSLLSSIPSKLPLLDCKDIFLRISFDVLEQIFQSSPLRRADDDHGNEPNRSNSHMNRLQNSTSPTMRHGAISILLQTILESPQFSSLGRLFAHLMPNLLNRASEDTSTDYGFMIIDADSSNK